MYVLSRFSHVRLFVTLWSVARQAPLSMGFSRQEYWTELPCPSPGDLPQPGMEPKSLISPALADGSFTTNATCAVLCLVTQSCPTVWDPMDCSPPDSSVHGDSPGKNTGVGCHAILQGIFLTQRSNPGVLHCRPILYHLSHQGSPNTTWETLKKNIFSWRQFRNSRHIKQSFLPFCLKTGHKFPFVKVFPSSIAGKRKWLFINWRSLLSPEMRWACIAYLIKQSMGKESACNAGDTGDARSISG